MAWFRRYQIRHARVLQAWWRRAYAWLLWIRRAIVRNRAARLLQRIARGFLGRCRARHALVKHYEEEWQRILAERERIRIRHENNAAVLLQARYRGMIARRLHDKLATEKRAKEMEAEMAKQAETEETRLFHACLESFHSMHQKRRILAPGPQGQRTGPPQEETLSVPVKAVLRWQLWRLAQRMPVCRLFEFPWPFVAEV